MMITTSTHILSGLDDVIERKLKAMPDWRLRLLYSSPELHRSQSELYRDAAGMSEAGLSFSEQFEVLRLRFSNYYRKIEDREIECAINSAMGAVNGLVRSGPKYPKANPELRARALRSSDFTCVQDLRAASLIVAPGELTSATVIDHLFAPSELICMAEAKHRMWTATRDTFRGREEHLPFIVPNVMAAEWGLTKGGRTSRKCNSNVGPVNRLVVEFDNGSLDEQASLVGHLMQHGVKILMALFSGGKSIHSWVDLRGLNAEQREKLYAYVAAIGADTRMFTISQFCRTPNAIRKENGAKQEVLMLNIEQPITASHGI